MEYKIIDDHPNYCISTSGKVYSIEALSNDQYKLVELRQDVSNGHARVKLNYIHEDVGRLVAKAFIPKLIPEANKVFHIDRNTLRNDVANLCWMTDSETKIASRWSRTYCKLHLPRDLTALRNNKFVPI
ncbi:HNH endonuclease [Lachnoclostridium sp. Marseille-P6806]|uniref:HNH endonuclease n=1 Tax=Lachnoclostridium sp. Marseille-P6806 TaxID=2364793 RepID=UPI001A92E013|nr:HNH endonuclease [Lachnoclostridium sp. Marseille-P6806]